MPSREDRSLVPAPAITALECWTRITEESGLDIKRGRRGKPDGYDVPLEDAIGVGLFGAAGPLAARLRSSTVSTEDLISAFFAGAEPFSMMLTDILAMFVQAGAKFGDRNLRIVFNFDNASAELAMTLAEFREQERIVRRVTSTRRGRKWTSDRLWAVSEPARAIAGGAIRGKVSDPAVAEWSERYGQPELLPPPPLPRSGAPSLDRWIEEVEQLLAWFVSEVRSFGKTYGEVMELSPWHRRGRDHDLDAQDLVGRLDPIVAAHSDYWPRQTAIWVCHALDEIASLSGAARQTAIRQFADGLDGAFTSVPVETRTTMELEESLRDLLSLPVWKRRHEVYAAWVGSRVMAALDDQSCEWHPDKGVLSFPFSGAHLASVLTERNGPLQFWTELRTKLETAVSGKRSTGIQPDYRILRPPMTDGNSATALVVECKQYRRSSTLNFAAAVNDYAAACADARVILVNNGPVGESVGAAVKADLAHRVCLIGEFRPDQPAPLCKFRSVVRNAILGEPMPPVPTATKIRVDWSAPLEDLDLHVIGRSTGEAFHVSFQNLGNASGAPWVALVGDVRTAPGPEMVDITGWLDGVVYEVWIHNFSGTGSLAGSDTLVTVTIDGRENRFSCPPSGAGRWWFVAERHPGAAGFSAVGTIRSDLGING